MSFDERLRTWACDVPANSFPVNKSHLGPLILNRLKLWKKDKIVEIHDDKDVLLTVREILDGSIAAASSFTSLGLGNDDIVLFLTDMEVTTSRMIYGCVISGAAFCVYDVADTANLNVEQFIVMLSPKIIVTDDRYYAEITCLTEKYPCLKYVIASSMVEDVLLKPVNAFDIPKYSKEPINTVGAYVYTSGTTGPPKAIKISHSVFIDTLMNRFWDFDEGSHIYSPAGLRWISQVVMLFIPALHGFTKTHSKQHATPENILKIVEKRKLTQVFMAPNILPLMVRDKSFGKYDISSWKLLLIAGEPIPDNYKQEFLKCIPHITIIDTFGATETAGGITFNGRICPGINVKVLDKVERNVGPNEDGSVFIKTLQTPLLGYLNNEVGNRKSFDQDGWYRTGDYGRVTSEGLLQIHSRETDLILHENTFAYPKMIQEIATNHPYVHSACVVTNHKVFGCFMAIEDDVKRKLSCTEVKEELSNYFKEKGLSSIIRLYVVDKIKTITTIWKMDFAYYERILTNDKYLNNLL
ncbi:hypothetical protein ACFFRR_000332 [Megaselia abdita]